ncbi:MAG: NAD(P)H-dependent glycerol-3-phosphate dehydrogenase [candidate division Zixibacteria bacterium]|nr:NAD(P)H-dependent glycerol-3-phosphate dehydrogenase [candidate division Zixibacteria bacterium]
MSETVSILGAGSWGLAVARLLHSNGHNVTMWEFDSDDYRLLLKHRTNPKKLPKCHLSDEIRITNSIDEAVENCSLLVLAVPSQFLRSALDKLNDSFPDIVGVVNLAKGIETSSLKRMSQVVAETINIPSEKIATISGPSHAEEVTLDMPTAVVAAGTDSKLVTRLQEVFSSQNFRVYQSSDLVGVELGGSLKNIIAIAVGIAVGLGLGDNTLGALITRGLAEISRLGRTMEADPLTFSGLSGVGDLVTTCASQHSRNRYVGEHIGRGESLKKILAEMSMVAEGVETTRSGRELARLHQVEMPITEAIYHVLFENKSPSEAVGELMGRQLKPEIWR